MAPQQTNDGPDNTPLAISPSLIVGIVIVAAFFCTIIIASVYRFWGRRGSNNGLTSAAFAARDTEDIASGIDVDSEFWNPNRQRSAAQVTRLKEVRWINNMYAWERGRQARMEVGEIRPTTMVVGRRGENKSWDEYTVAEDSSGQDGSGNASRDYPGGPYFYNADNPYERSSSQQRLSHLAPPTNYARQSYQSTGSGNGLLPRQPSALLPPPIYNNESVGTVSRRSPLRNEYQVETQTQGHIPRSEKAAAPRLLMVGEEAPDLSHDYQTPNPKITVNDEIQGIAELRSPFSDDTNFETISLHDEGGGQNGRGSGHTEKLRNFSRPREGTNARPEQRPSVIVTDGSLPQLQLQFGLQQLRPQNTASSIYDEDEGVDVNSPNERQPLNVPAGFQRPGHFEGKALRQAESMGACGQDTGGEIPKENVKGMIQDWERANGRFARNY